MSNDDYLEQILEQMEAIGDWPTVDQRDGVISLFILKSKKNALLLVENYLKNQKWIVGSSTDVRDAVNYITRKHPEFILLDSDHPYTKIKMLPKLLIQSFPVRMIAYTEKSTRGAIKNLASFKIQHILRPPISGPSVEKIIQKIRFDEKERDKIAMEKEEKILQSLKEKSIEKNKKETAKGNSSSSSRKPLSAVEKALLELNQFMNSVDLDLKKPEIIVPPPSSPPPKIEKPEKVDSTLDDKSYWDKSTPTVPSGHSQLNVKKEPLSMNQGVQNALTETTAKLSKHKDSPIEKINIISNVACITIESSRFSGYLICAFGKDRKLDNDFLKTVRQNLFSYLRDKGEAIKTEDESMNLEIESVPFEEWAIHQAEFLKKSVYNGNEIAMAFFPTQQVKIHYNDPASKTMLKMKIDDIKSDTVIDFDLYIYMAENKKYVLYTPQNMIFYSNQKDRLRKKGVHFMHLRKDSEINIKKYKARNFLNEKIKEWKTKRKSKS